MKSRLLIMKHDAKKSGSHYDIRIRIKENLYYSWRVVMSTTREFKVMDSKNPLSIIRVNNHSKKEAEFEGEIKKGYGAGNIKKYADMEIDILKTDKFKTHIVIQIMNGKYINQKWVFFNISIKNDKKIWILFKANKKKGD